MRPVDPLHVAACELEEAGLALGEFDDLLSRYRDVDWWVSTAGGVIRGDR